MIKKPLHDVLHLFFPHVCAGCGDALPDKSHQLCLRCTSALPVTGYFDLQGNGVEQKFYGRLPVRAAGAGYYFSKDSLMQTLIFDLKYYNNKEIGIYMGKKIGAMLAATPRFQSVDVLVPLPLNHRRQKKRGYNQALVICQGIAAMWGKPVVGDAVVRKVYTETQTKKDRISRWQNMDGVFDIADETALRNKHILLVDDVVTSGASLEACGAEICKVPGTTLSLATVACTS